MAESTSSASVVQRSRWNHQWLLSGKPYERVLPARKRHSPAPSFGHSYVLSTQKAAILFTRSDARRAGGEVPAGTGDINQDDTVATEEVIRSRGPRSKN
jgi:hypothetical protein